MKVFIAAWVGDVKLPAGFAPGIQDVTPEQMIELFNAGLDVALMHSPPENQTKKAVKRDGQKPDNVPLLALDQKYRKFRQR